jgi:outer membrane protein assembly complex protein YaeT
MSLVRRRFAHVIALMLFLAAAFAPEGRAQVQQYEGKEIVTIQFVPREQPLEPSELYDILPLKQKRPLRMADVRAAIERLFATGRYADVQVDAERYRQGGVDGVIVRILTKSSWFVGNIGVTGGISDPPNRGQIENASRLELGQPYSEEKVTQGIAGQKRLLESNGLYRSRIQPYFEWDTVYQQVHIRFAVESGKRASYGPPVFEGDLKLSTESLTSASHWRRWIIHTWKPVTQTRTRAGVEGILNRYQKENRLEAKVALDSLDYQPGENRVIPKVSIDAGPKIEVKTFGAKVPRKRLQRLVPIYEERAVDHDLLVEGARNLRNYFQSEGYFEAEVEFKQQRVTNDKASIDYLINPGRRHRLMYVGIEGNKYFDRETLRERMFLEPRSLLQFRHGRYSESFVKRDEESIANLYRSNGFRDVTVTHRIEENYKGKTGDIAVHIQVEEGPQYFVNSLQVVGISRLKEADILPLLSSAEGQPYSEFNVAVDRDAILARYFAAGFSSASFEWSMKAADQPYRVDLRYQIREGEIRFVRQVLISGLKITRKDLVDRNLGLNPGDPLSPIAITDTQRKLYDLGVFARVDTAVQNTDGAEANKYVLYEMDEARRWSLAAGFGAEIARIGGCQDCLDSPAGKSGFSPRVSLDVTRNNLWGLAHSISTRGRISTLQRRALVNYSAPRFRNREGLNLSFTGLYDDSRDVRTFSSKRQEGSAQLSQRYSKATTFFYRYTYRRVSVDESSLKIAPLLVPLLAQPVRLGMLTASMIQDRRDDPVDPRKGIYNTIDLGLAEHAVGSQRNFLRFLGRNATYHPLTRKLTLTRSTQFGEIYGYRFSGDPEQAIPLPERFFAGGGASHRGFPESQAGPRDEITGFPLGGTALFFNQTELRFPLIGDNVGGVLFHDAGNSYSKLGNLSFRVKQRNPQDFDYMAHAVGFGVRYRTPVGPIRVDLAWSINPPQFFGYKGSREDLLKAGKDPCAIPANGVSPCQLQNVSHFQFFFSIGQTF